MPDGANGNAASAVPREPNGLASRIRIALTELSGRDPVGASDGGKNRDDGFRHDRRPEPAGARDAAQRHCLTANIRIRGGQRKRHEKYQTLKEHDGSRGKLPDELIGWRGEDFNPHFRLKQLPITSLMASGAFTHAGFSARRTLGRATCNGGETKPAIPALLQCRAGPAVDDGDGRIWRESAPFGQVI